MKTDLNSRARHFIVLFPDPWLPYSPSILNLIQLLERDGHEVSIVTFDNGEYFKKGFAVKKGTHVLRIPSFFYRFLAKVRALNWVKLAYFNSVLLLKSKKNTRIIGVDSLGIFAASIWQKTPVLFSLEVNRDSYLKSAEARGFREVIIQTPERAEYLFPDAQSRNLKRIFYLQNSPIMPFREEDLAAKVPEKIIKFLYLGNIIPSHGVDFCIQAVLDYDQTSEIHLNGPIQEAYRERLRSQYGKLLDKRIFISSDYVPQEGLTQFISRFDVGFVFYDFEMIAKNDFNYLSCPSGKLFNYFAAGLPVIGSDILGLKSVKDFNAGILVEGTDPKLIQKAIGQVLRSYAEMSKNSFQAGRHFDYQKNFDSLKEHLL